MTSSATERYIPGMRIELRDAEWRIDRVDVPSQGGRLLTCTGHSELVRGKKGTFLTELETTPPADSCVHLGHQAAIDPIPYQLEPAIQTLEQTRPRILIADAVGLGKTISAGILTTELIRPGRGKRILVLGVKSMLGQLQQEFWQCFSIPLTRLDSIGLQRIRKAYRDYREHCHWDIVIFEEVHNVARRSTKSLRYGLVDMMFTRFDALSSFASLMLMLGHIKSDTSTYG